MFEPLIAVTSNYIISGEARKSQKDVAEFSTKVMQIIDYFEMGVDIQLTDPSNMTFSMFFYKNGQPIIEITA